MLLTRVFQIGEWGGGGGGQCPLSGGEWKILLGGFNLHGGGNLVRSYFDHSNLFQDLKQDFVSIEH